MKIHLKSLTLFSCFFLFSLSINAQKVKLKNFKVDAEHANLPSIGFADDVTTYDLIIEGDETRLSSQGINLAGVSGDINIGGYNKVNGGGSVSVIANIGTPVSSGRQTKVIDKEDKDKKKYKMYSYYLNLETSSSYKVVDSKGNILSEKTFPKTHTIKSFEFKSMAALNADYKKKFPEAKNKAIKKLFNDCIKDLNTSLNSQYGVGKVTSRVTFEEIKSKGSNIEKDFAKIQSITEDAFKLMTLEDNTAFTAAIQPALDFWVENEPKFSTSDKQEKKLNYACRYNAAIGFLWAEDFDNSIKYASMIEDGDYNEKKGKRLKERIEGIVQRMEKLNIESRHFTIDVSQEDEAAVLAFAADREAAYASGDIRQYPEFKEAMGAKMSSNVETGSLFFKNGKKLDGVFVYESNEFTPDFRFPKNIRFGMANGTEIEVGNPNYRKLDSIQIAETMYRIMPVQIGEGLLSVKLNYGIVEVIKHYDKTRLELCHPPSKNTPKDSELEPSYVVWHKAKEKHFSPDGVSFVKPMKKLVSGCKEATDFLDSIKAKNKGKKLLDKITSENYVMEDLYKVLELYDACK